jgi:Uma2 family endonuclease
MIYDVVAARLTDRGRYWSALATHLEVESMAQPVVAAQPVHEQRLKMSYEEYLAWEDEGAHGEWVDGEVIVFMPPTERHQAILTFLAALISTFADLFNLGVVRVAPFEVRARPDGPAREPDLLFVAREHLDRLTPQRLAGPADLVVEVVSHSSVGRDRGDKFYEYQEAGVPEYWILDPRPGKERADFYHLMASGKYQAVLPDANGRYHSRVLPGFWLDPEWLWREPLPNLLAILGIIAPQALREAVSAAAPEQRTEQSQAATPPASGSSR